MQTSASVLTQDTDPNLISSTFAAFVERTHWDTISDTLRHEVKRAIMNYFAVSLAGCNDPTLDIAVRTYGKFSADQACSIIGRAEQMDMLNAAALNAMSANVFDYDDTHIPTIIHPTAPVAAALFALSESLNSVKPLSGKDFMLAFLLGVEAQCRIGLAISPFHYRKGWHITSTCGAFGSAMAVGKTLKLDSTQLLWALGTAACQAGGLVEGLGTMAKSVSVGNAARNGMVAAFLAQEGFDGPARPLEGTHGFLNVFGDTPNWSVITENLGLEWELSRTAYKPYPCGVVLNPVIDACLALAQRDALKHMDVSQVVSIELTGHELLRQRTDRPNVSTGRTSQVSAQHAVSVALIRGKAGLAEFSDEAVHDPVLRELGKRLSFNDDNSYSIDAATVVIRLKDGTELKEHVDIARGAIERPLTDAELETKLRDLCTYGGSQCDPEPLIAAIWAMENMDDVAALARMHQAKR
jgi:2-methylcitrate dehydratase PrpD